jgi:hypothetical protein
LTHAVRVGEHLAETTDLIDSPGYVYLAADDRAAIERDYAALRAMEQGGLYTGSAPSWPTQRAATPSVTSS